MQHELSSSSEQQSLGESSLLAELAGEANQKYKATQSEEQDRLARSECLHEALGKVFQFLHLFSSHLNKIKPVIPRSYSIDSKTVYNSLQWSDASADYRKQSLSDKSFLDHVSFRVNLAALGPVPVQRRWDQVETLKRELLAFGLRTVDDLDALLRGKPQHELFQSQLAPDFMLRIKFQGNYETGQIDILSTNLDGFGSAAFTLRPEDVTQHLLDEIGRFLIGRKDDLPELLSRTRYLPKQPVSR